jgi:nucleolar protein 58
MARMVATKAALSIRVDALSDADSRSDPQAADVGITNRVKLESRLRALEHQSGIQSVRRTTAPTNGRQQPKFDLSGSAGGYNAAADNIQLGSAAGLLPTQPEAAVKQAVAAVTEVKEEKRAEKEGKKDKKKKRKSEVGDETMEIDEDDVKEGETKEERRARKEAKKAVSRSCFGKNTSLMTRPRLLRRLLRRAVRERRSRRRDELPRLTGTRWRSKMGRRRRRRRSGIAWPLRGVGELL